MCFFFVFLLVHMFLFEFGVAFSFIGDVVEWFYRCNIYEWANGRIHHDSRARMSDICGMYIMGDGHIESRSQHRTEFKINTNNICASSTNQHINIWDTRITHIERDRETEIEDSEKQRTIEK